MVVAYIHVAVHECLVLAADAAPSATHAIWVSTGHMRTCFGTNVPSVVLYFHNHLGADICMLPSSPHPATKHVVVCVQFSARDYLETALMPVGGSGPAVEAKNGIRASIKSLFPDRDCATLVRPMHDEEVSKRCGSSSRLLPAADAVMQLGSP